MKLAIENVDGSYVSTGAQAARVLAAVRDESLGLTWDPNNAGAAGERAFPDGYRLLDPARICMCTCATTGVMRPARSSGVRWVKASSIISGKSAHC